MSLVRIALRIAAVEAIKGRTLVGSNVLDTPNGAIDVAADGSLRIGEERPFISVYTDQGAAENVTGRGLAENGACDIVYEIGVSTPMLQLNEETGATEMIGIAVPATDRNFEFFLDVVQRQICDALTAPDNEWAEIYRGLHYRTRKIAFAGARSTDDGQRIAGHQLRLTVDLADDPIRGQALDPESPFMVFLGAMEASDDEVYRTQAAMMRSLVGTAADDRDSLQRRNGMTAAELLGLGVGPFAFADDGTVPLIDGVSIEVDRSGTTNVGHG